VVTSGDAVYLARFLTDDRSATALEQLFGGGKSSPCKASRLNQMDQLPQALALLNLQRHEVPV